MNPRRVISFVTFLIGAAVGMSLTGCGAPAQDAGQLLTAEAAVTTPSFSQEYKTGTVTANYAQSNYTSYTLSWSSMGSDGDVVYGTGWNPGNNDPVTYDGRFYNTCGGCFGIYGWTRSPLVEYYVCDAVGYIEGPHTSSTESPQYKCSFASDGDTYDVYYNMRYNADNIDGLVKDGKGKDFPQYISVRQNKRTSGTITFQNHLNAWASSACGSMTIGSSRERHVLGTEGWGRTKCGTASGNSQATIVTTLAATTAGFGNVTLLWSGPGGTNYTITRTSSAGTATNTVTDTPFTDYLPDTTIQYQYKVAGNGQTLGPVTILPAPKVTTSISGSTLTISWQTVTGGKSYVVQDSSGKTLKTTNGAGSYSVTVSSGTYYVYMVKASDGTTLGSPGIAIGFMP